MNCCLTLQNLYDSEINFRLSTFWDAGFEWALGDGPNGYKVEGWAGTYAEACDQLFRVALEHYPNSEFASLAREKY